MTNPHKGRTGIDRLRHALGYSISGLVLAYRGESAFRQEAWCALIGTPLAFWLGRGWVEVTLLLGGLALMLVVELLNSSIEAAVDRISFEWHELAKRAKDLASAAVLLSVLLCGGIWAAALWHRFAP